jgi:ATP-dependent Lhr-like helicase
MRFLLRWHHLDGAAPHLQPRGRAGIRWAVERLEGWLAPAATWEHHLLKPRVQGYEDGLLSELCLGGEVVWGRMSDPQKREPGPKRGAIVETAGADAEAEVARRAPTRISAMTFARRSELDWMLAASGAVEEPELPADVSETVTAVWKALRRRGASFAGELASMTSASPEAVEQALWDLLCRGLVAADDVGNLRLLCAAQKRREQKKRKRASQGRWSILAPAGSYASDALAERAALLYLQRYGIVFRDLCVREPTAPRWRDLLFCYRRMEARGEVRGGRFVSEVVGEQFALPEAVDAARAIRREPPSGRKVVISGVDPLNLTAVITSSVRVPRLLGEQVVFIDGVAQAVVVSAHEVRAIGVEP